MQKNQFTSRGVKVEFNGKTGLVMKALDYKTVVAFEGDERWTHLRHDQNDMTQLKEIPTASEVMPFIVNDKEVNTTTIATNNMFADRKDINEAVKYMEDIAKSTGENEIYVLTAMMVLMNTIGRDYILIKKNDIADVYDVEPTQDFIKRVRKNEEGVEMEVPSDKVEAILKALLTSGNPDIEKVADQILDGSLEMDKAREYSYFWKYALAGDKKKLFMRADLQIQKVLQPLMEEEEK